VKKLTDKKKEKTEPQKVNAEPAPKKPQEIKIENLKTAAETAQGSAQEKTELKEKLLAAEDKYLRLFAEFDNYRKRTDNEKAEFSKYAAGNFAKEILPVLDSFERSEKTFAAEAGASEEVRKGFALIHRQLADVLQKLGIQKMETLGKVFDPCYHEAVMQKESDRPPQTVLEELQTGYLLYEKVLRPAMVVVAK